MLFAAFLGYNPIQQLLGPVLGSLPPDQASFLTGRSFFPQLITGPFADGITAAFTFAVIACVVAAVASWFAGGKVKRRPVITSRSAVSWPPSPATPAGRPSSSPTTSRTGGPPGRAWPVPGSWSGT